MKTNQLTGLVSVLLFLSLQVSAVAKDYTGMLLELEIVLIICSLAITIFSYFNPNPSIPFIAGIFWMVCAFGTLNLVMVKETSLSVEPYYVMYEYPLALLFGSMAIICFVYGIFKLLVMFQNQAEYKKSQKYWEEF
jgi:hypothetical protein